MNRSLTRLLAGSIPNKFLVKMEGEKSKKSAATLEAEAAALAAAIAAAEKQARAGTVAG